MPLITFLAGLLLAPTVAALVVPRPTAARAPEPTPDPAIEYVGWGQQNWGPGVTAAGKLTPRVSAIVFDRPVLLYGIHGHVSFCPHKDHRADGTYHECLMWIRAPALRAPGNFRLEWPEGTRDGDPGGSRFHQAAGDAGALWQCNVKGFDCQGLVDVHVTFREPVPIPDGRIQFVFDKAGAGPKDGEMSTDPTKDLNVEPQLVLALSFRPTR
jgi:hypothetical protein